MKRVLHVGCGAKSIKGVHRYFRDWDEKRLDIDPRCSPDVVASITDLPAPLSDSFDALYSAHNLEHVHPTEVDATLSGFRRVLNASGLAILRIPDLQRAAEFIVQGREEDVVYHSPGGPITPLDMIFGYRGLTKSNPLMGHKTGFTQKTLHRALVRAGFATVVTARTAADVWALATKTSRNVRAAGDLLVEIINSPPA